ncbi:uncharacterized protein LOC113890371 [Bos indicus x Bos taurus]|uniref:uncharacterized protein LOC113890371 n=1 Tax=Bos indicus x Bos taurus TaxID=30522 RepID=UPI000D5323E4|nr:uncharacterized protein LOC113890371 [Bos indicus x Bos taurus]
MSAARGRADGLGAGLQARPGGVVTAAARKEEEPDLGRRGFGRGSDYVCSAGAGSAVSRGRCPHGCEVALICISLMTETLIYDLAARAPEASLPHLDLETG